MELSQFSTILHCSCVTASRRSQTCCAEAGHRNIGSSFESFPMHKSAAKFAVSRTDFWSALTLAVCIGMVLTLAVRAPATADQGAGVTFSSTAPADRPNSL
jgi:hypothetical protein